ncbi:hypothetical protein [Pseudomonas syringae]|uniref:hypothetical protein n=1 Tax=Pseudomonas syringae TaxID=317 RepID=UPI000E3151BE|nr:hypothetical protein [Pseudomonas syringae]
MKLSLDCEFTQLNQSTKLISLALVAETGEELYVELTDTYQVTRCWMRVFLPGCTKNSRHDSHLPEPSKPFRFILKLSKAISSAKNDLPHPVWGLCRKSSQAKPWLFLGVVCA